MPNDCMSQVARGNWHYVGKGFAAVSPVKLCLSRRGIGRFSLNYYLVYLISCLLHFTSYLLTLISYLFSLIYYLSSLISYAARQCLCSRNPFLIRATCCLLLRQRLTFLVGSGQLATRTARAVHDARLMAGQCPAWSPCLHCAKTNRSSHILCLIAHLLSYLMSLTAFVIIGLPPPAAVPFQHAAIVIVSVLHVFGLPPPAAVPFQYATIVIGFHAVVKSVCAISSTEYSIWGYALCRRPP